MENNGKVLTEQEILEGRSSKYEFINFAENIREASHIDYNNNVSKPYCQTLDQKDVQNAFIRGVKWQHERSYSEEEVWRLVNKLNNTLNIGSDLTLEQWFEQFKKK